MTATDLTAEAIRGRVLTPAEQMQADQLAAATWRDQGAADQARAHEWAHPHAADQAAVHEHRRRLNRPPAAVLPWRVVQGNRVIFGYGPVPPKAH